MAGNDERAIKQEPEDWPRNNEIFDLLTDGGNNIAAFSTAAPRSSPSMSMAEQTQSRGACENENDSGRGAVNLEHEDREYQINEHQHARQRRTSHQAHTGLTADVFRPLRKAVDILVDANRSIADDPFPIGEQLRAYAYTLSVDDLDEYVKEHDIALQLIKTCLIAFMNLGRCLNLLHGQTLAMLTEVKDATSHVDSNYGAVMLATHAEQQRIISKLVAAAVSTSDLNTTNAATYQCKWASVSAHISSKSSYLPSSFP